MIVLVYVALLLMGLVLGLVGAGGSILTVPILVGLMGMEAEPATGASLLVVGMTALVGAVLAQRQGLVDMRAALILAVPSMAGVLAVRAWLLPALPGQIAFVTKDAFILLVFSGVMLAAALAMLRQNGEPSEGDAPQKQSSGLLVLQGLAVGALTGFVGAGGGFLWIPMLILWTGLPMRKAAGTSLAIIAINASTGVAGDLLAGPKWDPVQMLPFVALAVVGMGVGRAAAARIPGQKIKPAFAILVLVVGIALLGSTVMQAFSGTA